MHGCSKLLSSCPMACVVAAIDARTGRPYDADASMLLRRLKIYRFTQRVRKPAQRFPFCACCFSRLVLQQGRAAAA